MHHLSGKIVYASEHFLLSFICLAVNDSLYAYTCLIIVQEEYEADDEMGKLDCGHSFHIQCIKQWLSQKNACPVCKAAVVNRC